LFNVLCAIHLQTSGLTLQILYLYFSRFNFFVLGRGIFTASNIAVLLIPSHIVGDCVEALFVVSVYIVM